MRPCGVVGLRPPTQNTEVSSLGHASSVGERETKVYLSLPSCADMLRRPFRARGALGRADLVGRSERRFASPSIAPE